ncbi:glucans biosynthesis glucosyltransferase MdoH [Rhodobacter ferrooxidans]|uniref:Glucans biosynthesis glucosyltransferase H n=1 Tax=Rhodobacter ferrooxidans TaxID=371731 RepID=C8S4L2_9RHOB|nr:glucans biosynthesis glucosyltransferase MdoH [Rhodobacter sp. SW2]EEW24095.1 glycosyl transferase family 2 [Rhodobacter sp. SW2]
METSLSRFLALAASIIAAITAGLVFYSYGTADGPDRMDVVRAALITITTWWLAWGAAQGLLGLTSRAKPPVQRLAGPILGRTVIIVPVYNEDPQITFARIAAMNASLVATGETAVFHFAVLSDTRSDLIARAERQWFARLVRETGAEGRLFYRRRALNTGKKAGNVEDFITNSGAAYDYALILDADSLMEGATIVEMVRRMEAAPDLGLLQSLPKIVRATSRFGRAMQFSAAFYSPVFARGLAIMQGKTGPFWGHNALVRVRAFAESCGLPVLAGSPPFGGHILSHDYVEAALLARAGWVVRLDDDLEGSYEEGPENIVDHAKRDRRWCQGNLQHSRLVLAPGLRPWSRFVFVQGIFAYIAPVFWMAFIIASIMAPHFAPGPDYFPDPDWPFPVFPPDASFKAIGIAVGVFGLLILPKLLIVVDAAASGRAAGFGRSLRAGLSTLAELLLSSLTAPVFLMYQSRSVAQVVLRRDGGWPTNNRGDGTLTLGDAWAASWWISLTGVLALAVTWYSAPGLLFWMLPVALPMIAAPWIIAWSSRAQKSGGLFETPSDANMPPVLHLHDTWLARWSAPAAEVPATENTRLNA